MDNSEAIWDDPNNGLGKIHDSIGNEGANEELNQVKNMTYLVYSIQFRVRLYDSANVWYEFVYELYLQFFEHK